MQALISDLQAELAARDAAAAAIVPLPSLSLPAIALCTSVTGFGTYEPLAPSFVAGKRHKAILYVEVDDFRTEMSADGWWETRLYFEATLLDSSGRPVLEIPSTNLVDRCRQRRRDFFISCDFTLPGGAKAGQYVLEVRVRDELSGLIAKRRLEISRDDGV